MSKITVIGAGSWGTAQAILLAKNRHQVSLWGRLEDNILEVEETRENKRFLPGVILPENLEITDDLLAAVDNSKMLILAVPAQAIREILHKLKTIAGDVIIVNTAKGIEISSGMRMSEVVIDVLGAGMSQNYAVLSGPSHAEEVGRGVPTVVTVGAYSKKVASRVQDVFMSNNFRVYTNPDVAGVELGGALKNIIALATGIVEGLGYGDNTKAALITRGLTEMTRMGVAMGGDARTFSGISGIGDLIVTCSSKLSRNRSAGEMLGQGYSLTETLEKVGMVVEGVHTTRIVHNLAQKMNIDMPITKACFNVLYNGECPKEELEQMMQRDKKPELEEIVNNYEGWLED
ncbi:MAG TPA: NAD(P)H-dependent glycerol-3-phosphate dehydrogenase [Syntrophomonadaceae bacterium]|nr:NAD(P)H-dependent glycerol-3-phosphate dehydrogenase [Syntrophomonadaceae bacterium]